MNDNIFIVLARARHSGNVGLAARAMKNTGLSKLMLVSSIDPRNKTAQTFGAPAREILDAAICCDDLEKALRTSTFAVGFTRRVGRMRLRLKPFLDLVPAILDAARKGPVHLVFGNERTGLSNGEISLCDASAFLPSHPKFPSMNLSHAVMLVGYELLRAGTEPGQLGGIALHPDDKYPTHAEIEDLFREVEKTLRRLDYRDMPRFKLLSSILLNLRNAAKRARITHAEVKLLRGVLSRLEQRL